MAKPNAELFKGWRWVLTQGFGENLAFFADLGLGPEDELKPSLIADEFQATKITTIHFMPDKRQVRTIPYFVEFLCLMHPITWFQKKNMAFFAAPNEKLIAGLEQAWSHDAVSLEEKAPAVAEANASIQDMAVAEAKYKTNLFKRLRGGAP